MKIKFNTLEILTIILVIATFILIITTIYYSNRAEYFQELNNRANFNAIINVLNYTQNNNKISITLLGTIENDGKRQAEITNITIGLRYIGEKGFIDLVTTYGGNTGSLLPGWNNSNFKIQESKNVNLILSYDYPLTLPHTIREYIIIEYFDGIGFQIQNIPLLTTINK